MNTYYHATTKENALKIFREGIKSSPMYGGVFLSDTEEGAMLFIEFGIVAGIRKEGEYAILPVYLEESEVSPAYDHNPEIIKANSFLTNGDIPASRVEHNLDKVPLYAITK